MSVNPYNFISLIDGCIRPEKELFSEQEHPTYTGVMDCSLKTQTPIFVPRNAREKDTEFFSYDHTNDSPKPIIPGSSIRGVIRSLYEALSNGCLSTVDDELVLYRRTTDIKHPGIIVKEQGEDGIHYILYEAERLMLNTTTDHPLLPSGNPPAGASYPFGIYVGRNRFKTGQEVYVKCVGEESGQAQRFLHWDTRHNNYHPTRLRVVSEILSGEKPGCEKGVVLIGERFQRKHHDSVFINKGIKIADVTAEYPSLENVWRLYQYKKNGGVQESNSKDTVYEGYLDANPMPVYYSESVGGLPHYLSPACMTKEVFRNTVNSILQEQGGYQPCDSRSGYCEACRLFGAIDDKQSIAGRVMFRDAVPAEQQDSYKDWYEEPRTIMMGGPKITATEFYMNDAGGEVFTYDYSVRSNDRTPISPRLRGRKFYWHSDRQENAPNDANVNMLKTIHPVKSGKEFCFTVAFDRLTKEELAKLQFALTLAFQDGDVHAHKLGHGKPIGYGSIKIGVTNIKAYTLDDNLEIVPMILPELKWKPDVSIPVRELARITNWSSRPTDVGYPGVVGQTRKWFSDNKATEYNAFHPIFSNVLPYILSEKLSLPDYFDKGQGNRRFIADEKREDFPIGNIRRPAPVAAPVQVKLKEIPRIDPKVREQEVKILKRLQELGKNAGKPDYMATTWTKEADAKLAQYLNDNPEPENASADVKQAYAAARKKLKMH